MLKRDSIYYENLGLSPKELNQKIPQLEYLAVSNGETILQLRFSSIKFMSYNKIAKYLNFMNFRCGARRKKFKWTGYRVLKVLRRFYKFKNITEEEVKRAYPNLRNLLNRHLINEAVLNTYFGKDFNFKHPVSVLWHAFN